MAKLGTYVACSNILALLTTILDVSLALSLTCYVDILIVSVLESIVPFHILMAAIVPSEILLTVLAYVSVIVRYQLKNPSTSATRLGAEHKKLGGFMLSNNLFCSSVHLILDIIS